MSERHRGFETGSDRAPNQILWIHGYTGSPDAFSGIAKKVSEELNACVTVPLLPGHGTAEERLADYSFDDFIETSRHFAERVAARDKKLAIVGYSFGGLIAIELAREFRPAALVLALTPYKLRFPFWLPGVAGLVNLRPFWGKHLTKEDIEAREGTFYYPDFPGTSLKYIKKGRKLVAGALPSIDCPILTLNTAHDPLIKPSSGRELLAESGRNAANESYVIPRGRHALFFEPKHATEEEILISFLKKQLDRQQDAA